MPNRIIKESICTSEEIEKLDDATECFFYRLMVNVDDYGRLDARPAILKSRCYPLKSIDSGRIQVMLATLQQTGLIELYQVDSRQYLHLVSWENHQQIRAKRSKYPSPEEGSEIICNHVQSDTSICARNPIQSNPESNPIVLSTKQSPDSNQLAVVGNAVANAPAALNKSPKVSFDYQVGQWTGLRDNQQLIDSWLKAYPGVDMRAEFEKMRAWLMSNKKNRKVNLERFVNNWLSKAQDQASKPELKSFAERKQDFLDAKGKKDFAALSEMTPEERKAWGFQ